MDFFCALLPLFCAFIPSPDDEIHPEDLALGLCQCQRQSKKENEQQPLSGLPQGTELSLPVKGALGSKFSPGSSPPRLGVWSWQKGVRSNLNLNSFQESAHGGEEGEGLVGSRVGQREDVCGVTDQQVQRPRGKGCLVRNGT